MRVLSTDPKAFRVETAFFILEGDLSLGVVRHSLRFNDGRTVIAAQHTGNLIDFRHGTRKRVVDVEGTIDDFGVEATGPDSFTVWHSSRIPGPRQLWQRGPTAPIVAQLRYTYTVGADLPSVSLKVELTPDPGIELHDVVLSTALDQLSSVQGIDYHRVAVRAGGTDTRRTTGCRTPRHAAARRPRPIRLRQPDRRLTRLLLRHPRTGAGRCAKLGADHGARAEE